MLVYVDESGDAGLKISQGSSPYFVVALIVFDDHEETQAVEQRIQLLRHELQLHPRFEFKFNKCSRELRLAFLRAVAPCSFFYYGIVIDKSGLYGEGFGVKESFYKYVTQLVFLNAREHLENAKVYLDAIGDRPFRKQINNYLKKKINRKKKHIEQVGFLNSANSSLIQVADMVAGAINRSRSDKADAEQYIKVIRHREAHLQVWPKNKESKP
ncbi:MAG: DUF3800 domain-containing protein [Elusimicrobia bacterium]|nr:DUF3800 domain-containing protein [Elusimicrobiota bacterium]